MEYEHKIGWLDPSGTMIECGHSDHIATARTLVNLYHYQNPDRLPEDDGWLARQKLKDIGCDIEEWYREEGGKTDA